MAERERADDMRKVFLVTTGGYTPSGRWYERTDLMDFKHAASYAAAIIRKATTAKELQNIIDLGITVWGGSLEVADLESYTGRATYDRDLEPARGAYIAAAIGTAVKEQKARFGIS